MITHPKKSVQLFNLFRQTVPCSNLRLYEHEGGHVVPQSRTFVDMCEQVVAEALLREGGGAGPSQSDSEHEAQHGRSAGDDPRMPP
jgi:hypothetical protein